MLYFIFSLIVTSSLFAINQPTMLESNAKTYEIAESDMYQEILDKRKDINATKLNRMMQKALVDAKKIDLGLAQCDVSSSREIDPGFIAPDDVYVKGQLIVKKGTYVNGLKYAPLVQNIVVLDMERCEEQMLWRKSREHIMAFIAKGDLSYYENSDYNVAKAPKILMERFGITCTPTVISQHGEHLIIKTIGKKELRNDSCK